MKTITSAAEIGQNCILKFGASWCAPCRAIKPTLERLESSTGIEILDVDVDDASDLANEYGIRAVPTLFAIKDGQVVDSITGSVEEAKYLELFKKVT